MTVDDEMLMAYLDGELDEVGCARVERALAEDEGLRARLEVQQRLRERLSARFDPVLDEIVPDRFREMLDPKLVPIETARTQRTRTWPLWQGAAALAATLVFGLVLGRSLPGESGPVRSEHGTLYASGDLADTLDTQLASAPTVGVPTRVGVSFARADGNLCRTFEGAALSGLACRDGGRWRLVVTAPGAGTSQSQYRQAGSANPIVMQSAQEMMVGEPLDAVAERMARDSGWRRGAR
jgi:hypothetical protein